VEGDESICVRQFHCRFTAVKFLSLFCLRRRFCGDVWLGNLSFLQGFEFVERAGPVCAEEARQASVREDFSVGLAVGAVIGFVVGVADPLDGLAAGGAGLAKAAMDDHVFAEGGDFFGEGLGGFDVEAVDPELEGFACCGEEALPLLVGEFVGELDGREVGGVENLVGVGVADAGENARVGEGSFEGAVLCGECGAEAFEVGGEDVVFEKFQASGVDVLEGFFVGEEVEGGSPLGTGFSEDEGAVGEVEGGEIVAAAEFGSDRAPVKAPRDHEVQDEPEAVVELDGDAFADAVKPADGVAFDLFNCGTDGAEEEWTGYSDVGKGLAYYEWFKCREIGRYVG
jgi:hypothetical protein